MAIRPEWYDEPVLTGVSAAMGSHPHTCHKCGYVYSVTLSKCPECSHATLSWSNPYWCIPCRERVT